jgi:hypothetical protein
MNQRPRRPLLSVIGRLGRRNRVADSAEEGVCPMSMYPCSVHGSRIKGPLGAIYVSVLDHGSRYSRRMRMCGPCLGDFEAHAGSNWVAAEQSSEADVLPLCSACGVPTSETENAVPIFATLYRPGQEREDQFGCLHPSCSADYVLSLGLNAA